MRRLSIAVVASIAALALILPAVAPATLSEVGVIGTTTPATVPSCPGSPCLAVSRTTGFQVKVGSERNLESAPRAGTIVAWTITLGNPNATQIKFFNANEGGPSEAGIAVLAPQAKPNLTYKLVAQSPMVKLQPYFGKTAQFPLETTIPVKKGYVIALDCALVGAGAGAGLRQHHLVAGQQTKSRLHDHQLADRPDDAWHLRSVLLPLPDRASDLQRHPHLNPVRLRWPRLAIGALLAVSYHGAVAPPVGLTSLGASPPAAVSLAAFSFCSAVAPPVGLASVGVSVLAGGVSVLSLAGVSLPVEALASEDLVVVVVLVDAVDVFWAAAASALVSVGGVISGVLLGTASETLVPPQALTPTPHSSAAHTASARRALTTGPCACRTWDSR